ncbi:hypothetical protein MOC16_gp213 [Klebsiella phage vB_KpM_FBKp24]|uniref:Uncharacterized protein n=1 Tax=Klebsiella phage vB_KpM_FBKp24 TaxID=2801834 RepID=A0A7U0GBQ2_9CAUD|nr:hypothetical protein MOC16_gp213 [Klebsiella phage vB_KpM_FBKp24]QQV92226.1 hypothetical protein vBKpMFBKp24_200 [Klebsiella phage vB_KpM_FBKp24]
MDIESIFGLNVVPGLQEGTYDFTLIGSDRKFTIKPYNIPDPISHLSTGASFIIGRIDDKVVLVEYLSPLEGIRENTRKLSYLIKKSHPELSVSLCCIEIIDTGVNEAIVKFIQGEEHYLKICYCDGLIDLRDLKGE